ncbi:methyltransferase [Mycobacterium sp. CSUR Q5927]|nr:methyltransferase [Mycobacterium sp. CSUR Q5927]
MSAPTRLPPPRLVRAVERVRDRLYRLHQRLAPAPAVMMEMILAAWMSQAITVAAELGVADALADGPQPIEELASRVGANPDALARLLRALISRGVFRRRRDGRYELNALADTLRRDGFPSMAGMARFVGSPQHREHWSLLADAVRTGKAVIPQLRGMPAFDYLAQEPDLAEVFNQAMTSGSEWAVAPLVSAYDFSGYPTIVDVGGGHGRLLAAVLAAAPRARGVLYDLPHVVAGAPALLAEHRVTDRVRVVAGSFFDQVPSGGDAYLLKNVIHDWPDEQAAQILQNVRAATRPGAVALLVELVIPEHDREFLGKWADLEMLVGAAARERTAAEYRGLLQQAGFAMTRVVPTASPFSVVEARAV